MLLVVWLSGAALHASTKLRFGCCVFLFRVLLFLTRVMDTVMDRTTIMVTFCD